MVTLNELLATTYTVVVKNYRVRQLATEESLATVTAHTPGDNRYVSRVAAPCFDGQCTAYSSPYPEAGKRLESTENRKMALFSRMLCWDGSASASAATHISSMSAVHEPRCLAYGSHLSALYNLLTVAPLAAQVDGFAAAICGVVLSTARRHRLAGEMRSA